jgi:hypothetical protein
VWADKPHRWEGRERGLSHEQIFSEAFVPHDFTPKVGAYLLDLVGFTRL